MTPIINLSHISYNYEEVSALNDISLEIYAGELIFFTGPNGCGKSTLFKLLNGLIFPTKGEYYFDNKKIDKNTLQDNIFFKIQMCNYSMLQYMMKSPLPQGK